MKRNSGLVLVLLITLLVYFPSLFYHFVGEDYTALIKIITSSRLKQVFAFYWPGPLAGGYFRPLEWIPFVLGYILAGLPLPPNPAWQAGHFLFAYHLLNILFHLGNVFLVYLIASFILKSRTYSALTALIFAVHPINAEVVCWVAIFGDIAFVFFSLLSLILFAQFYLTERKIPSLLYYFGSCLSFILALSAKEAALSLPLLIILVGIFLRQIQAIPHQKQKRFSWLTYFIIVALYSLLRKFLFHEAASAWWDLITKFPQQIYKLIYYLRDLIFPLDLAPLKQFFYQYSLLPLAIIFAFVLVFLFIYIFLPKFKQNRILLFSLLWIIVTLILPLLAPFAPARRHLYFPLVGYSLFLVNLISILKRRNITIFLLLLFIILEIGTSLGRNDLYRITGEVVQKGLFDLKEELPEVESDSFIYLVGIPGRAKNTPAFWPVTRDKIRFLYKNKNLAVLCLSVVTFTEKSIKESEIVFLDDFILIQSMPTSLEEFILLMQEADKGGDGRWINGFGQIYKFKILKRDKFGNVEKVMFQLNPQSLKGRKVYFIGFKDGKIRVLKSFRFG
jgi:hypothetical protein